MGDMLLFLAAGHPLLSMFPGNPGCPSTILCALSVLNFLKRCVPKALAFAFGQRLRSKTRCFKTRVLGRRLPNGKPQERLRFRDLRSKTLALKKRIAIISCDLEASLGARTCVQVPCVQKSRRFAFAFFLSPLSVCGSKL